MDINSTPLWTAVITPMLEDGSVDYNSLESILKAQNEAGNGILILGSTGEALNIDDSEAREVLEFTCKLERQVPLMCGIGGVNLNSTKAWTEYLNTLNIDCYLVVTPLYAKPGDEGQYQWFKEIMDTATRPCMMYNVPSRTGKDMSLYAVEKLNTHKNFWAIKEASGSVEKFSEYVKAAGTNGRVYSGDDAMMPEFSKHGCKGLVSVASNVWPKETNKYAHLCLSGELKENDLWVNSTNNLFVASNPIPVKWLMAEVGQIKTGTLRAPLTLDDMCKTDEVLSSHNQITEWFKNL
jgi:4-hydroxy-tetrahydrodipicolinate synthase